MHLVSFLFPFFVLSCLCKSPHVPLLSFTHMRMQVSVVYFRAGYAPNDYPTSSEWDARAKLESSRAVKCPTLAYQVAGTKKVQQKSIVRKLEHCDVEMPCVMWASSLLHLPKPCIS